MKAYGMALVLNREMGVRTDVHTDDEGIDYLRVVSSLGSSQLDNLQALTSANSWEVEYKGRPDEIYPFLAVVPSEGEGVQSG